MPKVGERWKDVVGYEGVYQVSNLGRLKSLARHRKGPHGSVVRVPEKTDNCDRGKPGKHIYVSLWENGKGRGVLLHRLVLTAFVGPCPEGMEACHFPDRDPRNNRLENLRWDTHRSNGNDMRLHGTNVQRGLPGEKSGNAKLTDKMVREIRMLLGRVTQTKLAHMFGVSVGAINNIKMGRAWSHLC